MTNEVEEEKKELNEILNYLLKEFLKKRKEFEDIKKIDPILVLEDKKENKEFILKKLKKKLKKRKIEIKPDSEFKVTFNFKTLELELVRIPKFYEIKYLKLKEKGDLKRELKNIFDKFKFKYASLKLCFLCRESRETKVLGSGNLVYLIIKNQRKKLKENYNKYLDSFNLVYLKEISKSDFQSNLKLKVQNKEYLGYLSLKKTLKIKEYTFQDLKIEQEKPFFFRKRNFKTKIKNEKIDILKIKIKKKELFFKINCSPNLFLKNFIFGKLTKKNLKDLLGTEFEPKEIKELFLNDIYYL